MSTILRCDLFRPSSHPRRPPAQPVTMSATAAVRKAQPLMFRALCDGNRRARACFLQTNLVVEVFIYGFPRKSEKGRCHQAARSHRR
jgi:hypothetical protein